MPDRLVRFQQSASFHFVTFSCHERQPLLAASGAYLTFEVELESIRQRDKFVVAGYVLMPEHVHLLVSEPERGSLAASLQVLKQQSAKKLKAPHLPHFWLTRYYDFNLWSTEKLEEKLRYMHQNPVSRGLVSEPGEWPWSSFRHYQSGEVGTVEIESHWTASRRESASS